MRVYRTVLVEDEGPARRRLENMIKSNKALFLIGSLECGKDAIELMEGLNPEILFMDIQLKDKNAFEVLEALKGKINCKVIFVTAYDSYALKAFEVQAIDYLLKPFNEERFNESVNRITKDDSYYGLDYDLIEFLKQSIDLNKKNINIPEGNKNHIFDKRQIIFIQSDRYYVYVSTNDEKRLIRITLKKLEDLLPSNFLRINKSIIINSDFVTQIEYLKQAARLKMTTGEIFNSSRTYYLNVKSFFMKKHKL